MNHVRRITHYEAMDIFKTPQWYSWNGVTFFNVSVLPVNDAPNLQQAKILWDIDKRWVTVSHTDNLVRQYLKARENGQYLLLRKRDNDNPKARSVAYFVVGEPTG
jgi:hypothetical protein